MKNYYNEIDFEAVEFNERIKNESDKTSEFLEMQSMYEEGLLEC